MPTINPFTLNVAEMTRLLDPHAPLIPELEQARSNPHTLHGTRQVGEFLEYSAPLLASIGQMPQTDYSAYRRYIRDGDRREYEAAYFGKRTHLAAAALRLFLGSDPALPLADTVHNYLWNICEESNWVLPAHERCRVDLFAAETAFMLADTLNLLGDQIAPEVRARVRAEVEQRVFKPYLQHHALEWWYLGDNNWNGVCNSSVAAAFLLLEPEPVRVAEALVIALRGLDHFLSVAFEADGGSNEGVAYWHYGLFNLLALSELLRARTNGQIDLLDSERMRRIAAYPAKMQLSGSAYAAFSDCDETLTFHPGFLTRLLERTGEQSLRNLLVQTTELREHWRLTMMLRSILWWDGTRPAVATIDDAILPDCGVARLTSHAPDGSQIVVAIKAGHNAENHNQNDIGSIIVHVDGENLLTDPGRGLYSRFYFGPQRYDNIFANSYGHSVPRIDGQLQLPGRNYIGQLLGAERSAGMARVEVELAGAYAVPQLGSLRRELAVMDDGTIRLADTIQFAGTSLAVEEALVTWAECVLDADNRAAAHIHGQRHTLHLMIEEPIGATFALEQLEQQSRANLKDGILKRLSVALPLGTQRFILRMVVG